MPAAATSRGSKRSRAVEPEVEELDENASASHLVSFLTGYDTNRHEDDEREEDDDDEGARDEASEEDYDEEDEDEDGDAEATPTKRARMGLVGTPSSSRPSPRSTPTKPRKTPTPRKAKPLILIEEGQPGFLRPSRSDAYFHSHARSSKTSGNSYSALVKPLSQAQYEKYSSGVRSKGKSKAIVDSIQNGLAQRWDQWELEMDEGFNLLFHGFGSKRRFLNRLISDRLSQRGHCVVVNGHFPGITIKDVLTQIEDTLSVPQDIAVPPSAITPLERSAYRIYAYFLPSIAIAPSKRKSWPTATAPVYLVIHNTDAPALRTPRALSILSLLACSPNIHLIASFDHLHTPLLFPSTATNTPPHEYPSGSWDGLPPAARGFNWIYHNATTFDDYDLELTYQRLSASSASLGGITSSSSGGISEEGALQILRSVPPMALRMLKLLLTRQLASLPANSTSHTAHPASITAPEFAVDNDTLQRLSREKFIAREEERYNALMGEFKDHGLVVEAQADGEGRTGRWVWVPLGKAAVERVLDTMKEVEV